MDLREQRGLELAATRKIRNKGGIWFVPSQTSVGTLYEVNISQEASCTCPDYETRGIRCKHMYAANFVMMREENADGTTTVTESLTITATKKTYPQNWPAYNAAQTHEQDSSNSCLLIFVRPISAPAKTGRPGLPLSDAVFSAVFKVYSTVSGRRFMSDLREAKQRGFIAKMPHYNCIFNYLDNPALTAVLRTLITESSLPLKSVETDFAVDSSGFSTSRFVRWFDIKYGKERAEHEWVKCHLMCGVKTNIVTAIEIGDRFAHDNPFFPIMVETTAKNFQIAEVSADKGYASIESADAVTKAGVRRL